MEQGAGDEYRGFRGGVASVETAEGLENGVLALKAGPLCVDDDADAGDQKARAEALAVHEAIIAIFGAIFIIVSHKDQRTSSSYGKK